ncbi:MAG TPA: flippase [Verrucomicrobia bacterium]|nr:MAG: hypothetical protein A2X46_05620 [Lentisphaerae bacterium GWF2_57_35]HBA84673.1 flippase [Verrucomicrobiota bacterium]
MKLGERTINNALFNALSSLVPLALSMILWPFIVARLGTDAYGVLALVWSVMGYFALLNLGLGNAVVKYVAEFTGRGDMAGTRQIIGSALTLFMGLGGLGLILILAIARQLAVRWMKIPDELIDPAYYAFCAASAGFFFTMLITLYNSVINGLIRYDITSVINAVMGAFTTIATAVVLHFGFSLLAVVLVNVAIPLATLLVYVATMSRLQPTLQTGPSWDLKTVKTIMRFGMYALLSRITDVIVRQVDILIIGAMLGVSSVTYYVIPCTILNRLTSLLGRIGMVIFPAVSELQGQRRPEVIEQLYFTSSRVMLLLSTACILPVLIFGRQFLALWMSPAFAAQGGTALILIAWSVYLDLLTNVPTFVVDGLGHPKVTGVAAFSHALVFLGLIVPLARTMGIDGVALSLLLSAVAVTAPFLLYTHRVILRIPISRLLRESYFKPLAAGALLAGALWFIPDHVARNLPTVLALMSGSVMAYFLLALLMGAFETHEKEIVLAYVRGVVRRLNKKKRATDESVPLEVESN